MDNRLKPIEEPFSSQISTIIEKYPQQGGYILKLFRVFANSIRFLKKGTVNLLDSESPITLRQREIVIQGFVQTIIASTNGECMSLCSAKERD